jgi:ABC-type multidrug transport system fused ATPase/permease subunit
VLLARPLPAFLGPILGPLEANALLLLNVLVGTTIAIALAKGLMYFYQQLSVSAVGQRVVADIRFDLYNHLQRLSFSFHDRRRTGDLLTRLTSDMYILRDIIVSIPIEAAGQALLVLGMVVVMFAMDARLTFLSLLVLPCLVVLVRTYQRPMKQAIRKQRQREGHLASLATEVLGAIKVVQGFRREQFEAERFKAQNKRSLRSGLRAARLEAKFRWGAELSVAGVTALVLTVAVRQVLAGSLSPGDILVFVAYLQAFTRPLRKISSMTERMARGAAAGERVLELFSITSTVRDHPGAIKAPRLRGEIRFENVQFAYERTHPVLIDLSLYIRPGERIAIVGPTGSGKTTLVSLIPRFYDVTAGRVCLDGYDVRDFTISSLRKRINLVFQESVLFATTIAENIGYGKSDATPTDIINAAKAAGIHEIISQLPNGYETVIGERGGTLSGGQRQCVAIARAFIKDAPVVILDEPTGGLDSRSSSPVVRALGRLMEDRTVLMISHQLYTLREANRIIVLEGGRIAEEGTHTDLLGRKGLYHDLHELQVPETIV